MAEETRTKLQVIELGAECNNRCVFCSLLGSRFDTDFQALTEALVVGARDGRGEVVFTGLEPTLHDMLPELIRSAKKLKYTRIRLETNARMAAYEKFARAVIAAGATEIAVMLPAADAEQYSRITGAPEGFAQMKKGVENLLRAGGASVYADVPVCAANAAALPSIARFAAEIGMEHITFIDVETGREDVRADDESLREDVGAAAGEARRLGLPVSLRGERFARLGVSVEPGGTTEVDNRTATVFCPTAFLGRKQKPEMLEALIRANFTCNQICTFCWVEKNAENPPHEEIVESIRRVAALNVPRLSFSGGEPTINPRLPEYIRLARELGIRETVVHTNAVRAANADYAAELRAAGLDIAFVTLLAHTAELSDSITRTEGTFRRTVRGGQNLVLTGVHTMLHFVILNENYGILPDFIRFVSDTFRDDARGCVPVTFSYVAPPVEEIMLRGHVPRFTEAAPFLRRALALCDELGVPFGSNEGLKGMPPCVLEGDRRYFRALPPLYRRDTGGEFVKKPECAQCVFDNRCYGVRRFYARRHGLDEIRPVLVEPPFTGPPGRASE